MRARRARRVDVVVAEHERIGEELDDLLVEQAAMARAQYHDVLGRPLLDALELLEDLVHPPKVERRLVDTPFRGEGGGALVAHFLRFSIREHQRSVRVALHLRRRLQQLLRLNYIYMSHHLARLLC